jgi:predicted DNA-binding transcriptional regulator YafY
MSRDVKTVSYRPALRRMQVIIAALRAGRIVNASGFARALETSTKSIHRDIDFLRWSLGFDIEYVGAEFGYRMRKTGKCPFCHPPAGELKFYSFPPPVVPGRPVNHRGLAA